MWIFFFFFTPGKGRRGAGRGRLTLKRLGAAHRVLARELGGGGNAGHGERGHLCLSCLATLAREEVAMTFPTENGKEVVLRSLRTLVVSGDGVPQLTQQEDGCEGTKRQRQSHVMSWQKNIDGTVFRDYSAETSSISQSEQTV